LLIKLGVPILVTIGVVASKLNVRRELVVFGLRKAWGKGDFPSGDGEKPDNLEGTVLVWSVRGGAAGYNLRYISWSLRGRESDGRISEDGG
jgi:hypothetical protein